MKMVSILISVLLTAITVNSFAQDQRIVLIETSYGNMKAILYNETPQHRDNFIKLVSEKFYDSLLFHRIIKDFMLQTGDPNSKNAPAGIALGHGGPGYQIPAEILPKMFHKKGALAAARTGDAGNPERKSSGSQFYIVQGNVFSEQQLSSIENKQNNEKVQQYMPKFFSKPENVAFKQELDSLYKTGNTEMVQIKLQEAVKKIISKGEIKPFTFTEAQRKTYTTTGGTPHLDGAYTVFGEIIEGLDVIDKIAVVKTNKGNRPEQDLMIKISIVK